MNILKVCLSYMLYLVGDLISRLLLYDRFTWLYPYYNKIMIKSCKLDTHGKVWKFNK
jgi:hypothetical protein